MTLRACLDCGEPTDQSRCPDHRLPDRKPSARARGYDADWDALSKRARRLQPWCTDCGATEDLQTDHLPEAWARHDAGLPIRLTDVEVCCGPCNRARGAGRTRGGAPTPTHRDPRVEARSALHTAGDAA
ncbi:Uncharacterised protein [Mycobacteroides abscessus subsp. abscessus]|uniref:hypothetical protein n=1 Tax=Mycobacteroides abscessus TaxID=36809 RepID=UPI0009B1594B|nr:hypothetical protein [Mycobacteroides abscessus]SLL01412.1 Uncharacterised protein [Mycobacteroides abscessus subsp. abscessus]